MPKARCYDPKLECCTPVGGIQPKFPIKVAEWCPDRVKQKNFRPKANGCGPEGGPKVPDAPAGADFKHACDGHDICYATCRQDKGACDRVFHSQMRAECRLEFGIGPSRLRCYQAADIYYTAVSKAGADAYDKAQKQGCNRCCP